MNKIEGISYMVVEYARYSIKDDDKLQQDVEILSFDL